VRRIFQDTRWGGNELKAYVENGTFLLFVKVCTEFDVDKTFNIFTATAKHANVALTYEVDVATAVKQCAPWYTKCRYEIRSTAPSPSSASTTCATYTYMLTYKAKSKTVLANAKWNPNGKHWTYDKYTTTRLPGSSSSHASWRRRPRLNH